MTIKAYRMKEDFDGQDGFVLIGAVWLLLLCATLVALIMLRAADENRGAIYESEQLQRVLDLDAATQTVAAELLIQGPASRWARLPAQGDVQFGTRSVAVTVTSEAGRLDLNDGDLKTIDDALLGLGCVSATRARFERALVDGRLRGRIRSTAEVDALTQVLSPTAAASCAADVFTIDGGLARPDPAQASDRLRRALALTTPEGATPFTGSQALRIVASSVTGAHRITIIRVGMTGAVPVSVTRLW